MKQYIIYLTTNVAKEALYTQTGDSRYETTKYIGSTTLNNDKYFGSSKWVIDDINIWNISSFKRETLFIIIDNDPNILLEYEKIIQKNYNVVNSPRFYNKVLATEKFTSSNFIWFHNPSTNEKGKFHKDVDPPSGWVKGSGYSSLNNKKAYYNIHTKKIKYFDVNHVISSDWKLGLPAGNTNGKKWYHNPSNPFERGCFDDDKYPDLWIRGMGDTSYHARKHNTYICYYNPDTLLEKHFIENTAPESWIKGSLRKTRTGQKWYHNPNNPTERGFFHINDDIPSHWISGKGFNSGGRPKGSKNKSK